MKYISIFTLLSTLLIASSCEEEPIPNVEGDFTIIIDDSGSPNLETDAFDLSFVSFLNNTLEVTIAYGGGCSEHEFQIIWDGQWTETEGQEVATIYITHDVVGTDNCEAYIMETLSIDASGIFGDTDLSNKSLRIINASNTNRQIAFSTNDLWVDQSTNCNLQLELRDVLCGASVLDDMWFSLGEPSPGEEEQFLQPVLDDGLANTNYEAGTYNIGVKILFGYEYDAVTCLAYVGPHLPVLIECIEKVD